jgi:hypothetical protein
VESTFLFAVRRVNEVSTRIAEGLRGDDDSGDGERGCRHDESAGTVSFAITAMCDT